MADFTNIDFRANGVNQDTNYKKQYAFLVNAAEYAEMLKVGTHDFTIIPAGEAITDLNVMALADAGSAGSATLQFKIAIDGTAEAINSTAIGLADLKAGDVHTATANKIKTFDKEKAGVLQITVGGADFTDLNFMLVVSTIPVKEFTTNG